MVVMVGGLLASAQALAGDWRQPNGNLRGTRAVDDTSISSSTVGALRVRWTFHLPAGSDFGSFASTPVVAGGTVELFPVSLRYAWPAELDLMARLAGLALRERWGGWRREPFGADSGQHVSLYARVWP